jgi:hypothetical protein
MKAWMVARMVALPLVRLRGGGRRGAACWACRGIALAAGAEECVHAAPWCQRRSGAAALRRQQVMCFGGHLHSTQQMMCCQGSVNSSWISRSGERALLDWKDMRWQQ